jgi:hypothetical protein
MEYVRNHLEVITKQNRSTWLQGCEVLKLAKADVLEENVGAILNSHANLNTFTDIKTYRKLNALLMNQLTNKSEIWCGREM